ncbi:DUF4157 domain-containing protein [Yinghuangia sp. ASG 101]|uniref:eCIS core domain-containing protein n=1 Tax=Yinghuangia sp. ASG 101 TaxID=2896848 RepID=UPI001E4EEC94|nr:DUF4157 domain-containing protein [Yinghuangia sp. ASG 101]UGQ10439.1 DUF4157 domain-containing protein [Yinghuangia sp. ASG 101]
MTGTAAAGHDAHPPPRPEGRPLDPGLRRLLEASFDHDLSDVVVLRGGRADRLCRRFAADGCASGRAVFLRSAGPGPRTDLGVRLLAHEVAHVVQQRRGDVAALPIGHRRAVGLPGGPHEREADAAADAALAGKRHHWAPAEPPPEAGRRAVAVLQLHASHEHRLIGDVGIGDMAHLAGRGDAERRRVLLAQRDLMREWSTAPQDLSPEYIARRTPWLKVTRLPNGVVMSHGELNALADYLPNPTAILNFPRDAMVSLLQTIREESYRKLSHLAGVRAEAVRFKDSVFSALPPSGLLTLKNQNALIASASAVESDHLAPLLCRNVAHFAPHSWYRWAHYHHLALGFAAEASLASGREKDGLATLAELNEGYAQHFLQDSFAAGHLGNKVLAMQWASAAGGTLPFARKTRDHMAEMSEDRQPGLSGRHLYGPYQEGVRSNDPQTVDESGLSTPEKIGRLRLDTWRLGAEQTYASYLRFLGNATAQINSMALHDFLNETGLWVASQDHEAPYLIGGDETLIQKGPGLANIKAACAGSEASVRAALDGKDQRAATAEVFATFPSRVRLDGEMIPLEAWHDRHVRPLVGFLSRGQPLGQFAGFFAALRIRNITADAATVLDRDPKGYKPKTTAHEAQEAPHPRTRLNDRLPAWMTRGPFAKRTATAKSKSVADAEVKVGNGVSASDATASTDPTSAVRPAATMPTAAELPVVTQPEAVAATGAQGSEPESSAVVEEADGQPSAPATARDSVPPPGPTGPPGLAGLPPVARSTGRPHTVRTTDAGAARDSGEGPPRNPQAEPKRHRGLSREY